MARVENQGYAPGNEFRLPDDTKRTIILGRTGSGKTKFSRWLLSMSPIESMPWIVIDYKQSGDYSDIPFAQTLKKMTLPDKPGVYILNADYRDDEKMDAFLFSVLKRGNTGLLFDEGAAVPQREPRFVGLKSVLAQGRGKRVPVIFNSQRPKHINKSLLSEGDFFARFHLSYGGDADYVNEFMPPLAQTHLPDYHSHWYDIGRQNLFQIGPVDDDDTLYRFDERLRPKRRLL